ncbi:sigma 54-interacting transcriptional regulator [Aliamphritea ceti]|uniref:sigma 54-interacting transcriptional regulator n=1 Tax=Aliamphritea ceti TaxID=1524258 RepID=UPI0021C32969|nr:sigma 54-interacting transcriptional regulator [Aliamphritea ceti]
MQMQHRILLLADTPQIIRRWHLCLSAQGYAVSHINDINQLASQERFDQLLIDLSESLPGVSLSQLPVQRTLLLDSANSQTQTAITENKSDQLTILAKSADDQEVLSIIRARLQSSVTAEPRLYNTEIGPVLSPNMQATLQQTQRIAAASSNLTIVGAAGSGKTSIAKTLHAASKHAEQPLTDLNCAQLSTSMISKTLFGDSELDIPPAITQTDATLLLRHIEQLDFRLQIQLSTSLSQTETTPRIIATTSADLDEIFTSGQLAADLYYQISDICLQVPSLQQRTEDIPLLAEHFLTQNNNRPTLSNSAKQLLLHEPWEGNVAQLKRCMDQLNIERGSDPSEGVIEAAEILAVLEESAPEIPSFNQARAEFERNYLVRILTFTQGKVSKAAKLAQRNRTDFYKLLAKHELNAADFKKSAKTAGQTSATVKTTVSALSKSA